jgi:signal transduction histidine kinase/CheY-like chemotaxis protein
MITRRELGPSDLDPGFLVTASILGLGVTLLMVALARTRNLQLRELSDRNQLITEQVDAQTRELEAARDEAFRAAKAKTDFLASMSHEIRTPLNAILGATEILTDTPMNDEQRHYLSLCRHAGESLLSLVNDVLDLSKIEAGHMTLEGVNFDAWALFEKAVELQAIRAAGKGLELVVDISPRLPTALVGDPVRLGQVLVNLLGNAVKFTAAGEVCLKVSLREGEGGGLLRISVTDTGIGIPPEAQSSIFESFTQGDSSTTRRYGGTGLGLTISRELVALMHGRLWVESEVGQGSRFHLELPLQLPPGAVREPPGLVGRRIVLLESHAGQRRVLSRLLRSEGADVLELQSVADLAEGIQGIGIPDLVLCAVRAPDTGAFDACAALCDSGVPAERIVMMLSALGGEDFARCADLGLRSLVRPVRRAPLLAFSGSKGEILPSTGLLQSLEPIIRRAMPPVPEESMRPTPPVAHPRVLLVEDNEDNRSLIRRYLRDQPYAVTEACDGAEAVEAVAQQEFAVILMDIQMPVMDGHEATGRIRAFERNAGRRPSLIVALTAHALPAEQAGIVAAGCDACLTKPIKKQTLLEFLAVQINAEPGSSQAVSSRQTAS